MKKRKARKISASQISKVPVGAKLVHDDEGTKVYLDVTGVLYLVRLEYVTYRLRGPRA
jgi:hypothetical protein